MGRDNHPKTRQLGRAVAKHKSAGYDRILIVTEGKKTEPQYFQEICSEYRLCSTNVAVQYCELGTAPIQVIEYARQLFEQGDRHKGIRPKSFDQIYAVFDRDEHHSYFEALTCAEKFNNTLKNDEKKSSYSKPLPLCQVSSCGCCCITKTYKLRFSELRF